MYRIASPRPAAAVTYTAPNSPQRARATYRITSKAGVDMGLWPVEAVFPRPVHAIAAMLRQAGYVAVVRYRATRTGGREAYLAGQQIEDREQIEASRDLTVLDVTPKPDPKVAA